jgi:hypothetical protein
LLGLAVAAGPLGLAEGVTALVEVAAAVPCVLVFAAAELAAVPGVHPPHSRATPATPPAVRTARRVVARGRFCVKSMHSS